MANRLVIEKATGRIMMAVSASVPVQLDGVYPPVAFNYLHWGQKIEQEVFNTPWAYHAPQNGGLQLHPMQLSAEASIDYALKNRKGVALLTLVRAVNRHRRLVVKEWQLGQEIINVLKYKEATRFLSLPNAGDSLNWLINDAEHFGISVEQAATAIIFRHDQQELVLLETERLRQQFTKAVLASQTLDAIASITKEIITYERKG